jgi:ABC-type antimicrobial peptide transport system permease subunit
MFAALAFLMTVVGIYGVLAFAVTQRTQEIGIRLALGAEPLRVLLMVLSEGAALVAAGVLAGFAGFWFLSRYLQSFLYGVTLHDPRTYTVVLVVVILVAVAAMLIPARRAASVDPTTALRHY